MAGVGKLLKETRKMQKKMEALQEELTKKEIEISSGGGAVTIIINGQQEIKSLKLDPEFLKEDVSFVEETILGAITEAHQKSKELNEAEMEKITGGFNLPGMI